MKPKAVYYDILKYQQKNINLLNENFDTVVLNNPTENTEKILESVELLFAPLGFKVDKLYIDQCPNLKVIASNTTGIPHIDKIYADMKNISVCALHDEQTFLETITPTSEHTVGLILSILRRTPAAHYAASTGNWDRRPWGSPMMVSRMTIGIIGMGRLGRQVKNIMGSFGTKVLFYDPYVEGSETDLFEMASRCNILSINAVVNNETMGLVDLKILTALPKNSIVVNTSRGEILDINALIDLLESGHLWGAAIDTIDGEYDLGFNNKFSSSRVATYARENNNLIITPHIGGSTIDAWTETEKRVIDKSIEILC